jgi:nitrogenase molybdenum-cofactor synthesis protein NifE
MAAILKERTGQIVAANGAGNAPQCERPSTAGAVSQRACVFCGARVVLYPIADAVHLVHGPIGCAAYTWDIRGALSTGPQLHRQSFCTDLRERDIIFGGERKLFAVLVELIRRHKPAAAFVYSTCVAGVIGDDVEAVCRKVALQEGIEVIPVGAPGFAGTKKDGYRAACDALLTLIGTGPSAIKTPLSINIIGDFNVAGETWLIKEYFRRIGIKVVSVLTGDGRIAEIRNAHTASFNIVQCSGSMTPLAEAMKERYGIPYTRVSFFGFEDTAASLYAVADHFNDPPQVIEAAKQLVKEEVARAQTEIRRIRSAVQGKTAGIYVGGAFKAISLVKALRLLGIRTVLAGTQTGGRSDYERLCAVCDPDATIVDDANPMELSQFILEKDIDIFIGGVKERPMAYKLGVAFVDHNHERKEVLAGFEGMVAFAREVHRSVCSPVWKFVPRRSAGGKERLSC